MNFYERLNLAMDYIEEHIQDHISYDLLSGQIGVSAEVLRHIFPTISGITLAGYIRRRRLTLAAKDLIQTDARVIDLAMRYDYKDTTTFSRAFTKFHGINPSKVKRSTSELNYFPKLFFQAPSIANELNYKVVSRKPLILYGISISTNYENIRRDIPKLYQRVDQLAQRIGKNDYGMISYAEGRDSCDGYQYWALWAKPHLGLQHVKIPESRWLKFHINCQSAQAIQAMSDQFYDEFLPTCTYQLRNIPELEYYHDGITEFLVPIV